MAIGLRIREMEKVCDSHEYVRGLNGCNAVESAERAQNKLRDQVLPRYGYTGAGRLPEMALDLSVAQAVLRGVRRDAIYRAAARAAKRTAVHSTASDGLVLDAADAIERVRG